MAYSEWKEKFADKKPNLGAEQKEVMYEQV